MNLDKQKWYVQWFFWSLKVWDAFLNRDREYRVNRDGTNLCFFIRTIFVWAPLTLVLHATLYVSAILALTLAPIYFFGSSAYTWGIGAVVTVVLAVILAVYLWNTCANKVSRYRAKKRQLQKSAPKQKPTGPSFTEVLLEWFIAKKKKICPIITFTKSETERVRS